MDLVFHALANHTRREIVVRLTERALTVGEIAEPLAMSLAAASKHIKVLERAGLIRQAIDGRRRICHLDPQPMATASGWLQFYERYWQQRPDALDALFGPPPASTERGHR